MKTVKILQLPFTESLKPFFSVTYYNYIYIDKNLRSVQRLFYIRIGSAADLHWVNYQTRITKIILLKICWDYELNRKKKIKKKKLENKLH